MRTDSHCGQRLATGAEAQLIGLEILPDVGLNNGASQLKGLGVALGDAAVIELDAERGNQLWVPRGFAHGFCTTEPDTEVVYKVDAPYAPQAERSLAWDDPTLGIEWPVDEASVTLAAKDAAGLSLGEIIDEIDRVSQGEAS